MVHCQDKRKLLQYKREIAIQSLNLKLFKGPQSPQSAKTSTLSIYFHMKLTLCTEIALFSRKQKAQGPNRTTQNLQTLS